MWRRGGNEPSRASLVSLKSWLNSGNRHKQKDTGPTVESCLHLHSSLVGRKDDYESMQQRRQVGVAMEEGPQSHM